MHYTSATYRLLRICIVALISQIAVPLVAETCLPPLKIEIAQSITDIAHLRMPDEEVVMRLINNTQLDDPISSTGTSDESVLNSESVTEPQSSHDTVNAISEGAAQATTSTLFDFIMNIPTQLPQQMTEHLREFSASYQSYIDNHSPTIFSDQAADATTVVTPEQTIQSTSQIDAETQSQQPASSSFIHKPVAEQSTPNRLIVIEPQITHLVLSLSSTEDHSVLSVEISTLLIHIDSYSNPHQLDMIRSVGHGQQRIVLANDSTEQQVVERINRTIATALTSSINSALEKARQSVLREYSNHLATDNAFTFISVGSSNNITVGMKIQIVSAEGDDMDVCDSEVFLGLLQVAEQYDDYLVAHTRGNFTVPPNALLISKPEVVAIQPFIYALIPAIEFQGYSNVQQIAVGSGVRLYPRAGIDRLQPFFALTADAVIEDEGILLPLHGWFGLGINWYSGRVTISPRLSGGIGIGSYIGNTQSVTSFFASGLAAVQGSLLLNASLELGIELGYQFGIPISDTITVISQSLQTGYGGIFAGGTLTFFD